MKYQTAADMAGHIEIREDKASGMYEVFEVATGRVLNREQSDYDARAWRAQQFTVPRKTVYCGECLAEDLFVINCKRHTRRNGQ